MDKTKNKEIEDSLHLFDKMLSDSVQSISEANRKIMYSDGDIHEEIGTVLQKSSLMFINVTSAVLMLTVRATGRNAKALADSYSNIIKVSLAEAMEEHAKL